MIGRASYAVLFCVVIPTLLVLWARGLEAVVRLPRLESIPIGMGLGMIGLGLMLGSIARLATEAGGLPMNAYPPARRATGGPYAWLNHPIYIGFVVLCAGASIGFGSASGLWIVTPAVAMGCAALVWGYERDATCRRFGPRKDQTILRICAAENVPANACDRMSVFVLILLPWLIGYEAIGHLQSDDVVSTLMPFERAWPVWQQSEWAYICAYPLVVLAPFAMRTRAQLRAFSEMVIVAMVIAFWCYLALPLISPPRLFVPDSLAGRILALEQSEGLRGRAAFPSFHVCWTLIGAWAWSTRGGWWRFGVWLLAFAIASSCVTNGMHSIADAAAGVMLFAICWWRREVLRAAMRGAEAVANAWFEWNIGRARVLVHAGYAWASATVGVLITGWLAGDDARFEVITIALGGLIGAGIWGQVLGRGSGLARPFGYFGHILGSGVAIIVVSIWSPDPWRLAAALATAAPVVQGIGRLRCLVQGCCHGRPTGIPGIRYFDPRSRVCRFTENNGVMVHATPVYSIAGNLLIAGLLLRLWSVAAPASFVVGIYLLLQGLARFVEEHFRGEPRTPIVGGLRLYQWLAMASVAAGAILTVIPTRAVAWPESFNAWLVADGLLVGLVYAFAMGVDFPASNRRFARLA